MVGESITGYGLYAAGNGRLGLAQNASAGPPSAGTYAMGDLVRDGAGSIFYCVAGGTPGTWRSLLSTAPAISQLHLVTPARMYDSRGGDGPYGPGTDRLIPPHPSVPSGATAVLISLLVFGLSGPGTGVDGYVTAYAAGTTSPGTVNAYWGNIPGTQISSTTVVQISSSNQFRLRSTTAGGSVSLAVDLLGYYL